MRKILSHLEVSLDGVVEAPETWAHAYFTKEMTQDVGLDDRGPGTVLLGRKTYEQFAQVWPNRDSEQDPFARFLNSAQKIVASSKLKSLPWGPAEVISGDVEGAIAELKHKRGSDIVILGSPTLVGSLVRARLLDALDLFLFPVLLGRGRRLFEIPEQVPMKLAESKMFANGVLRLRYEPAQ